MLDCAYCNGQQILIGVKNNLVFAEGCRRCSGRCEKCDRTGVSFYQNDKNQWFSKPCTCTHVQNKIERLNRLDLPGRYFDARFDNFEFTGTTPKLKRAIEKSKKFVDAAIRLYDTEDTTAGVAQSADIAPQPLPKQLPPLRGLLFYGTPGTGKTRLLSIILKELILRKSIRAKFIEFSTLIGEIKKGYDSGESEKNLIAPLIDADILGIDELAKGRRSEWWIGIVDDIITGRYNAGKITLFSTNYNPGKSVIRPVNHKADDDIHMYSLQERLNDRIYSRLVEMCDFVDMNFTDYRKQTGTFISEGVKIQDAAG